MVEIKILRTILISLVMILTRFVMINTDHKRHFKQKTSMILGDIDSSRRWYCHEGCFEGFRSTYQYLLYETLWKTMHFAGFSEFPEISVNDRNKNP